MKRPPKKYAKGGFIDDPKKKKEVITPGVNTPNTNYPSYNQQMAAAGKINPTTADILDREQTQRRINSGGITTGAQATLSLQNAGTGIDSGKKFVANDASGNTTYRDTQTGELYTVNKDGIKYSKGGRVRPPKMYKKC
jgi:hypothetical protein